MSLLLVLFLLPGIAMACGHDAENLCTTETGAYRIALPDAVEDPPAVIWLHGWGGSANGVMKNTGMVKTMTGRGYALIAPDGRITSTKYKNKNWAVNDGRDYERDDIRFMAEVIADITARHGIDRERILLSGFSRGGSMVWDVACRSPRLARAYAPVAGAFWEPMWQHCEAGVDLFHTHGWSDRTVPLEGRPLGGGTLTQGDVFQSLFTLRLANGCTNRQPDAAAFDREVGVLRRAWTECRNGRIDLMLHPGGHGIPKGWLNMTLDWFEARMADDCRETVAQSGVSHSCG
jgi:polyhydroxybutyrate depolymerase